MDIKGFIINVKMMRQAQRDYFATRSREALMQAKDLERKVDDDLITIAKMFQ